MQDPPRTATKPEAYLDRCLASVRSRSLDQHRRRIRLSVTRAQSQAYEARAQWAKSGGQRRRRAALEPRILWASVPTGGQPPVPPHNGASDSRKTVAHTRESVGQGT